jgi:hypothetical protein
VTAAATPSADLIVAEVAFMPWMAFQTGQVGRRERIASR